MLGLHNIFLIAPPPPSSFNQPIISSSHQIPNLGNNDQQESRCPRKEYSLNLREDFENSSSSRVCKDCGNRAKKECEFRRCRTCCKSRAFNCATHVKSTWIPAARRKELRRGGGDDGGGGGGTSGSSSGAGGNKRPRENLTTTSSSLSTSDNNAAAFNLDAGSICQETSFKQSLPSQVQAPAVFRCIRVTTVDGGDAQVAYQAMVNISGHLFKGFLYNQGIDDKNIYPRVSKIPSDSTARNRDSTSPILHPPDSYPPSASQRLLRIASR